MAPIVCWDFDETLGYFRPLEFRYLGGEPPFPMPEVRLKPGIHALLASLPEFRHVVTTAAIEDYAREVLLEHDLLKFFDAVIGRESGLFSGDGKDYLVVGRRFGIDEGALKSRLAIVGNDDKRDPDLRHRQVVMIFDDRFLDQPSEPIAHVLRRLWTEGDCDFKRGFDCLLRAARESNPHAPAVVLPQGVKFGLDYWGKLAEGKAHPMVIRPRMI